MKYQFEEFTYRWERQGGRGPLVRKLLLPPSLGHKRAYEQAARMGVSNTTADGIKGRRIDDPLGGKHLEPATSTAIWQRDERQVKYERPLMLYSHVPGRRPLLVMGLGVAHVEAMQEKAAEYRHYGWDEPEIPAAPVDYDLILSVMAERAKDKERGRFGTAATPRFGGA